MKDLAFIWTKHNYCVKIVKLYSARLATEKQHNMKDLNTHFSNIAGINIRNPFYFAIAENSQEFLKLESLDIAGLTSELNEYEVDYTFTKH